MKKVKQLLFLAGVGLIPFGIFLSISAVGGYECQALTGGTMLTLLLIGAALTLTGMKLSTIDVKGE